MTGRREPDPCFLPLTKSVLARAVEENKGDVVELVGEVRLLAANKPFLFLLSRSYDTPRNVFYRWTERYSKGVVPSGPTLFISLLSIPSLSPILL